MHHDHLAFLKRAIALAAQSVTEGGFPAGSVVVQDGNIIGEGISIGNLLNDPTSHSDMAAIRAACKNISSGSLSGAVLYSSVQPCLMCLGASLWGDISKIFYACAKERLSPDYYGGHHDMDAINNASLKPVKMVHVQEMEEESLVLVRRWEVSLK